MDRKAMYKLSYGLFILTAKEAEKDNGCIINTAIQAASEPNQLSILSLIHISPSHGMPINLYDSRSTGAESYRLLAAEVISRGEEL